MLCVVVFLYSISGLLSIFEFVVVFGFVNMYLVVCVLHIVLHVSPLCVAFDLYCVTI